MQTKETWEELQIKNDFLFAKVMRDKKICMTLLETLLQTKVKDIVYLEEQKVLDIEKDAKSVRLDVYIEDGDRVFDLEMQTTDNKNLPERSRYYQGMIDLNTIEKGESYKKLKESYVMFICTFDPFCRGKAQYTFENLCLEDTNLKLNDGTKKIFFNTSNYSNAQNEDIREFLKYVNGEESNHLFVKQLEYKVTQVKACEEWRLEYMTLRMREEEIWEEAREEGLRAGREEGREKGREEGRKEGRKKGREEGRKEGREEGREEGIRGTVSVLKDLGIPSQTILIKIQEEYNLTPEISRRYLQI